jgi:4-azaleucine resistance transporter AzlC
MPRGDLLRGMRLGLPILVGYLPIALAFGVIARNRDVPLAFTAMMSALVYAGASQFMALRLIGSGLFAGEIILATLILNFRHFLMSASLFPRLERKGPAVPFIAFGVTDETFAVAATLDGRLSSPLLLGLEAAAYVSWLSGSLLGYSLGNLLPEVLQAALGMALYGLFLGILMPEVRKHGKAGLIALVAAASHLVLKQFRLVPSGWGIILAMILGSVFGVLVFGAEADGDADHAASTEGREKPR